MRIPENAIIPDAKLTRYLLVQRPRNDKSQFLAQAGFTAENPEALLAALRQLANSNNATEDRTDQHGTYYEVKGTLQGINGINLTVVAVWLQRKIDQQFQFITLVPSK
ncbi:hypothetical protein BCD67_18540 [Oscillatoriales cyanobacterium USR001]|nr:hypothetical protein BCD67_18540 [Oscillatoriales cyanobacterium USR001]